MDYGYVCFAYSKNEWIARAIAWFTGSQWSHSFITVPSMLGKQMALEAAGSGVSMVAFDSAYRNNPNQNYAVFRFKADQFAINCAILRCVEMLETPYGYAEYPWFVWRGINKALGRDIKSQNNWSQQGTVCSGLVRMYLEESGYATLLSGFGKDSANAQDVYEAVLAHPELFELVETNILSSYAKLA